MHEQKIDDDKAEKGVPCKICHNLIKPSAKGNAKSKSSPDKGIKKDEGIKSGPPSGKSDKQAAITGKKPKPPRVDDDDDDEDDRRRPSPRNRRSKEDSSSTMMFILLGGGAFVLLAILCGGGGIGLYFVASGAPRNEVVAQAEPPREEARPGPVINPGPIVWDNPNPGPIFVPNPNPGPFPGPGDPFQPPENLDPNNPNNIDRVITLLKGPAQQRGPAYRWLRAADPVHPRRNEVSKLLDPIAAEELRNQFAFAGDFFPAFFRWATVDNVPTLKKMAENPAFNPSDNERRQQSMLTLGRLKEASAAELILSKLDNAFDGDAAFKAMVEMGPVGENAVLKCFNHPNGGARDRARKLVKGYNTATDKIMTQCIADLDAADNNRRNSAVQWFAGASVDAKRRPEVARALNKSIPQANFFFEKDLAKVLETWGTAENVPPLVQRLQANKTGNDDVIRVLGKLRDPSGIKAIAQSMTNFFNQGAAKAALKEIGPTAEPAIVEAMNLAAADANNRRMYVNTLGEIGTMQSVPALTQIAFRFQQDKGFVNDVQRAIKSIQSRGK
jgi:hypothetical protein